MSGTQTPSGGDAAARLTATVNGMVQGVGFRFWTLLRAEDLGLTGDVRNQSDGTVRLVAEGPRPVLAEFLETLRSGQTPGDVDFVEAEFSEATGEFRRFNLH